MKQAKVGAAAVALRGLIRAHGVWVALIMAMLFTAAPGIARAATCSIDFSVVYNATSYPHVMSMTSNFDEFSACDPRYIVNPGDPASGFSPYVQTGSTANGGSFTTQVNATDDTIVYNAPTGFSGMDTFTVYFCDDAGCSTAGRRVATVTVTVGTPTIAVNPATLPAATVATAYSQTLTGAGGRAPYGSFVVTAGALPAGLGLNSTTGALAGTPTASGAYSFTIRTTDSSTGNGPFQGSRVYSLTVNAPTVVVNPATVPDATVGVAYSQAMSGAGGVGPYSNFLVTAGALPAGLSLNSTTGALTGTPTAGGSFNFTIRTTDSTTGNGPHNGSRAYSMTVNAPTITVNPASLPGGTQGSAYSQTITASGGTAGYAFAVTSGALPGGLTLAPGGALTGTPTVNGSFNFQITATDSSTGTGAYTGFRNYTLVLAAPPAPVANAVSRTVAYNSTANAVTLNITGGAASSVATPGLPTHGTVNIAGTSITYTPTTGYAGPDSFTYTATNAGGTSAAATVTITVSPPTITVSPTTLPNGATGVAYSQNVTAAGGSGTYTYAITSGTQPTGLTLSSGGVLSGTPSGTGPYTFTVTATDTVSTGPASPFTGPRTYSITIATPDPAIANPVSTTVAYNSVSNPVTLNITGGTATSVAVSTQATNGTATAVGTSITYTPTGGYSGPDSFAYTATNADGTSAPATVTITVNPQPPVAGAVSATVTQDSSNNPITLNLSGGAPASLGVSAQVNGVATVAGTSITFTPTAGYNGPASFSYTATNAGGTSAPATVSITVNPLPPIAGAVSATVAFNSSANPIPLAITGGTPASVATPGLPVQGTVSIAGTSITYTPSNGYSGSDSFTYTATNSGGTSAPATVTLTVSPPPAPIAGAASATVAANSSNNPVTLNLSGGAAASVATPSLPANGTVSIAGTSISYTPTAGYSGPDSFTYTATNLGGTSAPATVSVTVSQPVLSLTALTTTGQVTAAYSSTVTASLGTGPYGYAVTAGAEPTGLTLSPGGVLSGTATAAGAFNFTVTATDAYGATGSRAYTVTISAPTVTIVSPAAGALPSIEAYGSYSQTFTATGGVAPQTFALTAGALPPGLSLSAGGLLTGQPTSPGTYNFSITPIDGSAAPGPYVGTPRAYSITVTAPTIGISPSSGALTARTTAVAFSQTFTATGGVGPYDFAITAGALPPGVGLSGAGVLSGTPTSAGTFNFTVTAQDSHGFTTASAYSITVSNPVIAITGPAAGALPSVEAYGAYSQTFTATGGTDPRTFLLTAGALPPGLGLTGAGVLSGAPTSPGTYNFSITASDSSGAPGPFFSTPRTYSITVTAPTITLSPSAGALTARTTALAFSQSFVASGGVGPHDYAITAGALPAGVSLTGAGVLSGTPTSAGTFNFTVTAQDSNGFTGANAYSITVTNPVITVTSPAAGALPGAATYSPYSQTFTASGGTGPRSFAITAGALPPGVSLSSGGVLSGTPTAAGTFNFNIVASDSSGAPGPFMSTPVAYSLTVAAPTVTITGPAAGALPGATASAAYSQTFTASGGLGPHDFAVTAGALPAGVSLSSSGVLSGTPTTPGTYNFSLRASDASGAPGPYLSAPVAYSLTVAAPTVTINSPAAGALPGATASIAYSQTFTASGGAGAHSFAITAGALPAGMSFSSAGIFSGTPTAPGAYNFTVTASDSSVAPGPFSSTPVAYSLTVAAPTVTITSPAAGALSAVTAYNPVNVTFTASGGLGPRTFAIVAGALPAGVSFSSTGSLSGSPTTPGTYNFSVVASDSSGAPGPFASNPAAYSLTVNAPTITISPASLPSGMTGDPYSQTFSANGGTASYSYTVTAGALPAGIGLSAGGSLSGTPTTAGTFGFTVTATDANGFIAANSYSLVIIDAAPVAEPDTASTPANAAVGIPVTANDTGVITSVLVATPPSHGTTSVTGLVVTYTPAANYFGTDSFTYTATGPGGTSAPATVTVTVTPLAVPTAAAKTVTVLSGQSATIDATAGSTGAPITAVAVATAPGHGTATVSGTDLLYTPTAGYSGTDSFTYTLANPFGISAPATVTVTVNPAPITPTPITVDILAGQSATVNLTASAAGGPFTAAALVGITPPTAGTGAITSPSTGQYVLTFTPSDTFSGTVTASYTLSNAFATSAPGTVTVIVTARPDPASDPEVTGLISSQGESARRFATAQIGNFNRRLESLRDGGGAGGSLQLGFSGGSRDTIETLDPVTRRRMAELGLIDRMGDTGVNSGAGGQGGGANGANGFGGGGTGDGRVGLWAAGVIDFGQRDARSNQSGVKFTTDGLSAGADIRFGDQLVLGAGIGWGHDESRIGNKGTRSEADGYNFAVYGSYQPADSFFIDGVLGYGTLEFDSRRYITATGDFAIGQRDGSQWFGAVTGGWDMHEGRWQLSPYGRISATRSEMDAFTETTGGAYALAYDSQTVRTLTGAFGLRGAYAYKVPQGQLSPSFRFEYSHDFEGAGRASLSYADWVGGPVYGVQAEPLAQNRVLGGLGLQLLTTGGSRFAIDYETMLGAGSEQQQIRLQIQTRF